MDFPGTKVVCGVAHSRADLRPPVSRGVLVGPLPSGGAGLRCGRRVCVPESATKPLGWSCTAGLRRAVAAFRWTGRLEVLGSAGQILGDLDRDLQR